MEDDAFSDEFCRFLRAAVPSVDAAELLLLLDRERSRWWSATEAAAALAPAVPVSEADSVRYFGVFQANALVAVGPDRRVQYRPANSGLEGHVATLAQAYRERPVTLIRVIYALRDSSIQSFADAFKLKRS
ncbi:MAG TPA: hypothetical protein VFR66_05690 [Burkholderiales bacterium]|nr:hypothetical protein [Burkholderiales bacterium]